MLTKTLLLLLGLFSCCKPAAFSFASTPTPPPTPDPVVRAVLFYSPSCGHCHYVITEVLPPLFQQYGSQLHIIGIDVSQPDGQALFLAALQHFKLETSGVPFLVVGDTYLVGSGDIPAQLPSLVEQHLAQGGVDWPPIPGLAEALSAAQTAQPAAEAQPPDETQPPAEIQPPATDRPGLDTTPTAQPVYSPVAALPDTPAPMANVTAAAAIPAAPSSLPSPTPGVVLIGSQNQSLGANFAHDPIGNSLAVLVLIGMLLSLGGAAIYLRKIPDAHKPAAKPGYATNCAIPVLCLIGLGVAGYLAYVETTQVQAVCGPVGDCNTVQQSEYARLFGILPIGILGVVGYLLILLAWWIGNRKQGPLASLAWLALLLMSAFGVIFSAYLTFLEPFVIGATCAWCLTSAILMTVLFWLLLPPGKAALYHLFQGDQYAFHRTDSGSPFQSQ